MTGPRVAPALAEPSRGVLPDPPLCWDQMPGNATRHCTIEDPLHDGDHHHEYSGASWPRRAGGQP
ncbi:hypothetical protein ABZ705_01980 [Streptomyces sp. NPDC006984]|uniref:hypothetical protein n=1 Tax=unclassified Streptomyces TaxID=2593676 RepID=UPI0034017F93